MSVFTWFIIAIILFLLRKWLRGGKCTNQHEIKNQFIIITGSSSGIGKATAEDLVAHGAKVLYACRSEDRAKKSIEALPEAIRHQASFLQLDLCSFKSIQAFANAVISDYPLIDILINNAGAAPDAFRLTEDGIESYLQGNHLGPMLLTLLLLNHFNSSQSKIINVSSRSHWRTMMSVDHVQTLSSAELMKAYYYKNVMAAPLELYGATKLMNIYFTQYLAENLPKKYSYIKAASLHPGFVKTPMTFSSKRTIRRIMYTIFYPFLLFIAKTEQDGIQTHLHLSYMPSEDMVSGAYYVDCKLAPISSTAKDSLIREAVMKWSLDIFKSKIANFNSPL